jgi:hypothetical protein
MNSSGNYSMGAPPCNGCARGIAEDEYRAMLDAEAE